MAMISKIFYGNSSVVWLLIILISAAFLLAIAILLVGILHKPAYNNEVLRYFDKDFLLKASQYNRMAITISIARQLVTWIFLIGVIILTWKYFSISSRISIILLVGYIALFFILLYLLLMPLDYLRGFVIEHQYGLSTQTINSWLADFAKNKAISLVISTVSMTVLYVLMIYVTKYWWVVAGAILIIFLIIATYLYPLIIDPLFYKFEPLEDKVLKAQIVEISERAGIKVNEVLVADASRRTNKANAYFTGLGNSKRIVIFDNLLNKFSEKEALSVIVHEVSHWRYLHILKGLALSGVGGILGIFLLKIILGEMGLVADARSILIIILLVSIFTFITLPVPNAISRFHEKQADIMTIQLTGDPEKQILLMTKLADSNLSNVVPHPFIKVMLYSHPPIIERIKMANQYIK